MNDATLVIRVPAEMKAQIKMQAKLQKKKPAALVRLALIHGLARLCVSRGNS